VSTTWRIHASEAEGLEEEEVCLWRQLEDRAHCFDLTRHEVNLLLTLGHEFFPSGARGGLVSVSDLVRSEKVWPGDRLDEKGLYSARQSLAEKGLLYWKPGKGTRKRLYVLVLVPGVAEVCEELDLYGWTASTDEELAAILR
jgi:hypothetical protein